MIDFEKEFNEFVTNSNTADPITSIYNLFPNLSDDQIKNIPTIGIRGK